MDDLFDIFGSFRHTFEHPNRQFPHHHQQQSRPRPSSTWTTPKVVSIPVEFAGTSSRSVNVKSDSALKIQKVFRGFLVRKNVKKVQSIDKEVEEVAKRIEKKEVVELIRRDSTERLRVQETLMSLLFRLDSIRGVDSGVRDCRKKVIKKAIALQETVDAIAASAVDFGNQTLAPALDTDNNIEIGVEAGNQDHDLIVEVKQCDGNCETQVEKEEKKSLEENQIQFSKEDSIDEADEESQQQQGIDIDIENATASLTEEEESGKENENKKKSSNRELLETL